jgi:FtsP/CotA-like multicopper oxidase with cupredoxin domain
MLGGIAISSISMPHAIASRLALARLAWWRALIVRGFTGLAILGGLGSATAHAQGSDELVLPPICSVAAAQAGKLKGACEVTSLGNGHNKVQIDLRAQTGEIEVGGYKITTYNYAYRDESGEYRSNYLTPVVEALPGDTVAAQLTNKLTSLPQASHGSGHRSPGHDKTATNLHYFHGGVVSPNNARGPKDLGPKDTAIRGNGDNIYIYLKSGDPAFKYDVPIPSDLDSSVLEQSGPIPHPSGLNWYHSHLHGISSAQVTGGMSGLLSVGDTMANVKACIPDPKDGKRCLATKDAKADNALKAVTDVQYALLRDISLKGIKTLPTEVGALPQDASERRAVFAPEDDGFREGAVVEGNKIKCKVWNSAGVPSEEPKDRLGYCQPEKDKAWLFTLNGQRFPTITIEGGRNRLLRLGNLSANVPYWLEIYKKGDDKTILPLTLLSVDGVVPSVRSETKRRIASRKGVGRPVQALPVSNLLLMPASRAEIYLRNDWEHSEEITYILRTKGVATGDVDLAPDLATIDLWPEIQLAQIVLKRNDTSSRVVTALNSVVAQPRVFFHAKAARRAVERPTGCLEDIDPRKLEHRRVTFFDSGQTSKDHPTHPGLVTPWSIKTEIVRPPLDRKTGLPKEAVEESFIPDDTKTVGMKVNGEIRGIPFEEYDLGDGSIDWTKNHVCVFIDPERKASHKQLWVLHNKTPTLHNFHIHQMKFRLATADDLNAHKISLAGTPPSVTIDQETGQDCLAESAKCLEYKLYEPTAGSELTKWHDTIPMPPLARVYIVMSFDAKEQQLGRYVFHCHILKHEDNGLMAPIEVWAPTALSAFSHRRGG